jgi:hypothetical protein
MEVLHIKRWRDVEVAGLPDVDAIGQHGEGAGEDVAYAGTIQDAQQRGDTLWGAKGREGTAGQTAYECIPFDSRCT